MTVKLIYELYADGESMGKTATRLEFCGIPSPYNNPIFKPVEFEGFKNESGKNSFTLSPQKWIATTGAIGIVSKSGRYGGTFAHRDKNNMYIIWMRLLSNLSGLFIL